MSEQKVLSGNNHHLELIAQKLIDRRIAGDTSKCEIKFLLKKGQIEMMDSAVAVTHSEYLNKLLNNNRTSFTIVDMKDFHAPSVKRCIDWMYTGQVTTPINSIGRDLTVAKFLKMDALCAQLGGNMWNNAGSPIYDLNTATAGVTEEKKEQPYGPWLALPNEEDNKEVYENAVRLVTCPIQPDPSELVKLTFNSVVALVAAPLGIRFKIPIFNYAIIWILTKKPERPAINTILQNMMATDITFDTLYSIRYSLRQFLFSPNCSGKCHLELSPNGSIGLNIEIKANAYPASQPVKVNYVSNDNKCPPMVYRTKSELSDIQRLPDPFEKKRIASSVGSEQDCALQRKTTDGFPKRFTISEVESLQRMTDPFQKSEKEKGVKSNEEQESSESNDPKKCEMTAKYSESTLNEIQQLPDPFFPKKSGMMAKYSESTLNEIQQLPDPFHPKKCEMTAKYSESTLNEIQQLPDPFHPKKCEMTAKYSESTLNEIQQLPDPFQSTPTSTPTKKQKQQQQQKGPVIMSPASIANFWSRPKHGSASHYSRLSQAHKPPSLPAPKNEGLVTCATITSDSQQSLPDPGKLFGIRKTQSEIDEINALPDEMGSKSSTSSSRSKSKSSSNSRKNKKAFQSSHYMYPR